MAATGRLLWPSRYSSALGRPSLTGGPEGRQLLQYSRIRTGWRHLGVQEAQLLSRGGTVDLAPKCGMAESDLPPDHPITTALIDKYFPGQTTVQVSRSRGMALSRCYFNVLDVMRSAGGSMQMGWHLQWWPGHFAEALHHSVWRRPDGELEDVTEGPSGMKLPRTTFIPEAGSMIGGNLSPGIPSKFIQLDHEAGTTEWIELTRERMKLIRRKGDLLALVPRTLLQGGQFGFNASPQLAKFQQVSMPIEAKLKVIDRRRDLYSKRFLTGDFSLL